ncbi:MAG: ABC transporter permease [Saprospiraceae bacterium]|nr:ABC transporter permease [Saprospiraceae bacterium]
MFKHFITIALRRLFIDRTFSLINLVGLIIGISAVFLLSKYIGFHLTTDAFQENKRNLFAIHQTLTGEEGKSNYTENTYHAVAPLVKDQFPEATAMSRYLTTGEILITATNKQGERLKFNEPNVVEVDPDFVRMFTFHFLEGDPQNALEEPNSMVLSASMAKKYFQEDNPLGQTITTKKPWGKKENWTITGVFKDYPKNSRFQFDCLQSLTGKKLEERDQGGWSYPSFKSYLLLDSPASAPTLSEKMKSMIVGIDEFTAEQESLAFHLVALADETSLTNRQKLLMLVGLVLLLITWINYTNLSGAKSLTRGKEFGLRRILGSNNSQLIKQFLSEALLIYGIAIAAIIALISGAYPFLFDLSGGQLLPILEWNTPINLLFLGLVLVGAVLSSAFPSFSVSHLSVISLLKGNNVASLKSPGFRKSLVVFQFTISIIMLIGITTIYKQMRFISNQELGFETDQILILKSPKDRWYGKAERMKSFKSELNNQSFSQSVASSTTVPLWWSGSPTDFQVVGQQEVSRFVLIGVDEAYFECYGLDVISGETFNSSQFQSTGKWALVNEMATRKMGYASPTEALHRKVRNQKTNEELEIIGVVKDHHHESLRKEIKPQVFEYNSSVGFVSIHLKLGEQPSLAKISNIVENTRNLWQEIYPDQAFDYYFLDERFNDIYEKERALQHIFLSFTIISVAVTFLGVFGLSIFISLRRRKEIGIRKTLGAKPAQILLLFSNAFIKRVGLSIVIGAPIAYHILTMWLASFRYRISLDIWTFMLPSIALLMLVVVALSFEGIKMAKTNPVDILKED